MQELSEHHNEIVGLMQKRFDFIKSVTDSIIAPPESAGSHMAEIYKSTLKSLIRSDRRTIVDYALKLAAPEFAGGIHLLYAMLHLPKDVNERGNWHRDGNSDSQRVFWFPLTEYDYDGLRYLPFSSAFLLSRPMSALGSRMGAVLYAKSIAIKEDTFFSWSPRLVHKGTLNTSDHASCALQIFLDKSIKYVTPHHLADHDRESIASTVELVKRAFQFDDCGAITGVSKDLFPGFPENFRDFFFGIFQLRTNIDLLDYGKQFADG